MKPFALLAAAGCLAVLTVAVAQEQPDGKPNLAEARAALQVPPPWFDDVRVDYDMGHPWDDARLEVRRLMALGGEGVRQGIKLTYLYVLKGDIGNGHEYPMYLFMGGEFAWGLVEYEKFLAHKPPAHTHGYLNLASSYRHFGEYESALDTLNTAMARLPEPPWRIARQADIHDAMGDVHAEAGDLAKARADYRQAIDLYPKSTQPYGRHLLRRQAAKVQTKLDLLDYEAIRLGGLRDGTYSGRSRGFAEEDVVVHLTVRAGKISEVTVDHQEKIDMGSTTIIPHRIVEAQSVKVDAITGATVTCQAIVDGAFQALKKAGLEQ